MHRWYELDTLRIHPSAWLAPALLAFAAGRLAARLALAHLTLVGVQTVYVLQSGAGRELPALSIRSRKGAGIGAFSGACTLEHCTGPVRNFSPPLGLAVPHGWGTVCILVVSPLAHRTACGSRFGWRSFHWSALPRLDPIR